MNDIPAARHQTPVFSLSDAVAVLDALYPPVLAEAWDAIGLVAGQPDSRIATVAFAVDPTLDVIDWAIKAKADLLVVHHPLFFRPVNSVAATSAKGAIIHRLIEAGCALYTAHTNADAAGGGVADALAQAIGLSDLVPLVPSLTADVGTGRVGRLTPAMSLADFARRIAAALPPTEHGVRVAGDLDGVVERVAVVGGAGDSLFAAVRAADVDAYVTADLRHHPALEAREEAIFTSGGRPWLLDVSHSASEWHWLARAASELTSAAASRGTRLETRIRQQVADPWTARIGREG